MRVVGRLAVGCITYIYIKNFPIIPIKKGMRLGRIRDERGFYFPRFVQENRKKQKNPVKHGLEVS